MPVHTQTNTLASDLAGHLPLAFGVSGPLATPLSSTARVAQLVQTALEAGIRLFDTAPLYGKGLGEERLGEALKSASSPLIMTKAGVHGGKIRDFAPAAIQDSVEQSLSRLKTDRIFLLWLHGPAAAELTDELLTVLQAMKTAGKVTHVGIAGRTDDVLAANSHDLFEAVMLPLNCSMSEDELKRVQICKAAGRTVFAIETLTNIRRSGPPTLGSLWRKARKLSHMDMTENPREHTADEAIRWAFSEGGADVMASSTTNRGRLRHNAALVRAMTLENSW
ncbi:MAG: hypothetical protein CMK09_17385 [Ponticaulis sp.]|nr:hypothetical protein [Ponticaulis sp.]|tara:strand:- start:6413 stop:7249 length:837 start_codon:yes stop_codon:yes gene_type:complete